MEDMRSVFSLISLHSYESSFQLSSLTTGYTFPRKCESLQLHKRKNKHAWLAYVLGISN